MKKLLTLLLLFPISLTAQEKYFHELKGMEDSTETTHLFFRTFIPSDECCSFWTDHVTHFETSPNTDSVIFESVRRFPILFNDIGEKYVEDYFFLDNDIRKPFWILNRDGSYQNIYSHINGYNESFFYSGHHWGNRISYGKNDTLSFVVKNYESNSSIIILEDDSLPSEQYGYPILVKAIPEEPVCFENYKCFYGASDSVRFFDYNFLEIDPYQPEKIYLTRNDSLFVTPDLGMNINFLNDQFDWNSIGSLSFSQDSTSILATTEQRFRINGELSSFSNYQLLQSLNSGKNWREIYSDTSRIYINYFDSLGSTEFYMGVGKKLFAWNQLADLFSEIYTFDYDITGIYITQLSNPFYVLTKKELLISNSAGSNFVTLKKLPISNEEPELTPVSIKLHQNYPNPFNPTTTISFELDKPEDVTLTIFDALGRTIAVLVDEQRTTGVHEMSFDATNLSSGIYFYRLEAGAFSETKRFTLIK
ncbi:MAG: T9SS type A sorting domain-containing protein [Balneola sp.]